MSVNPKEKGISNIKSMSYFQTKHNGGYSLPLKKIIIAVLVKIKPIRGDEIYG